MHLEFSKKEELFREEVSSWLSKNLKGKFKPVVGRGGSGDQTELLEERVVIFKDLQKNLKENSVMKIYKLKLEK